MKRVAVAAIAVIAVAVLLIWKLRSSADKGPLTTTPAPAVPTQPTPGPGPRAVATGNDEPPPPGEAPGENDNDDDHDDGNDEAPQTPEERYKERQGKLREFAKSQNMPLEMARMRIRFDESGPSKQKLAAAEEKLGAAIPRDVKKELVDAYKAQVDLAELAIGNMRLKKIDASEAMDDINLAYAAYKKKMMDALGISDAKFVELFGAEDLD